MSDAKEQDDVRMTLRRLSDALDDIRSRMDGTDDVDAYNALVDEYNNVLEQYNAGLEQQR